MRVIGFPCLFLALLLISFTNSSAQSRGLHSQQISTLDLVIGGDVGFRTIKENNTDPETAEALNNRTAYENLKLNYRLGFNYNQAINGHLLIKIGLRITNPGFSMSSIEKFDVEQDINSIRKTYLQNGWTYKYKYQLVEMPVGLKNVFSGSRCKAYVEVGLAPVYYQKTLIEEESPEGVVSKTIITEHINRFNLLGFAAMGGDFEIAEGLSGFSQITARYQLNNLRMGVLQEKMIGVGLEMGIRKYL